MGDVLVLRRDFEEARRARFIDACMDLIDKSAEIFARQPGLRPPDIDLLAFDISPSEKYDNFVRRLPPPGQAAIPPERKEEVRLLLAGVIVHERLRQARAWLGFFEGFASAKHITHTQMDDAPAINVRREVVPEVYDRLMAQTFPTHVTYALNTSDRVFTMVKAMDRALRTRRVNAPDVPIVIHAPVFRPTQP
jgi:hypothetical protein